MLVWLARRPHVEPDAVVTTPLDVLLPGWVPLSRQLGGFYVVRQIGRGAGGSVLLAVRSDERTRADRELVALKVPDYSAEAARNLSEQEFEQLFREEAGALLALPVHGNLARFVTFDASAQPKPILVMEFVRGPNLERTLEGALTMPRALAIVDNLLAGLEAMHAVQIAHLDIKPPNVVLRESTGAAVLVDFGLAGRRIRTGCGSVHYGAAEVWSEARRSRRAVSRGCLCLRVRRLRGAHRQRPVSRRVGRRGDRSSLHEAAGRGHARSTRARASARAARRAAARGAGSRAQAPADRVAATRRVRGDRARAARAEVADQGQYVAVSASVSKMKFVMLLKSFDDVSSIVTVLPDRLAASNVNENER